METKSLILQRMSEYCHNYKVAFLTYMCLSTPMLLWTFSSPVSAIGYSVSATDKYGYHSKSLLFMLQVEFSRSLKMDFYLKTVYLSLAMTTCRAHGRQKTTDMQRCNLGAKRLCISKIWCIIMTTSLHHLLHQQHPPHKLNFPECHCEFHWYTIAKQRPT